MLTQLTEKFEKFKVTLGQISYQHGKLCAQYPLVVLTLVFTLINCLSSPALYHIFVNGSGPTSIRFLELISARTYPNFITIPKSDLNTNPVKESETLILEQIYITSDKQYIEGRGIITKEAFDFIASLENELSKIQITDGSDTFSLHDICFKNAPSKSCFTLSPLHFSHQKFDKLLNFEINHNSDTFFGDKLEIPVWTSYSNLKINNKGEIRSSKALVITYFFKAKFTDKVHEAWDNILNASLEVVKANGNFDFEFKDRSNVNDLAPHIFQIVSPSHSISAESMLLGLGYITVILYLLFSINQFKLVKSKFWLGFAAVFILNVSLLMAFGITLLCGYQLTLIPWQIIPFLIIAIGAENMLRITNAVVSTSVDLPVKERIGRGLERCGSIITLHLVVELFVLLAATLSTNDALQQFGTFGAIAVVLDYALQLTFFLAVLAIDIRRMELSDLQDRRLYSEGNQSSPSRSNRRLSTELDESFMLANIWESLLSRYKSLANYPVFKMASLLGSLALAWLLTKSFGAPSNLDLTGPESNWVTSPDNYRLDLNFWAGLLKANYGTLILVRSPTCIILNLPKDPLEHNITQPLHWLQRLVSKINGWYLTVAIFLFSFISFYIWLLYQVRDQPRNDWTIAELTRRLHSITPFYSDIALLQSNNHELVIATSMENELVVWNYFVDRTLLLTDAKQLKLKDITAVAVSKTGYVAVADEEGVIKHSDVVTNSSIKKMATFETVTNTLEVGIEKLAFFDNFPYLLIVMCKDYRLLVYDIKASQLIFQTKEHEIITFLHYSRFLCLGSKTGQLIKLEILIEDSIVIIRDVFSFQRDTSPVTKISTTQIDNNTEILSWIYDDGRGYLTLICNDKVDQMSMLFLEASIECENPLNVENLKLISDKNSFYLIRRFENNQVEVQRFNLTLHADTHWNFELFYQNRIRFLESEDVSITLDGNLVGLRLNEESLKWQLWSTNLFKIEISHLENLNKQVQYVEICDDPLTEKRPEDQVGNTKKPNFDWLPFDQIGLNYVSLKQSNCFAAALSNRIIVVEPGALLKQDYSTEVDAE